MTWLSELNKARWVVDLVFNPWVVLVVWVMGAAVYFLPPDTFGVQGEPRETIDAHRGWIALGALAAFVAWVSLCLARVARWMRRNHLRSEQLMETFGHLDTLSPEEQSVLAYCLLNNRRTVHMTVTEPFGLSLVSKGFLVRASGTGDMMDWPYTIPSAVWDLLQSSKDTLLPPEIRDDPNARGSLEDFMRSIKRFRY